jgi:hypothetical protein
MSKEPCVVDRRFKVSGLLHFRLVDGRDVEVTHGDSRLSMALDRLQLLLQFGESTSIGEAQELVDGSVTVDELTAMILDFAGRGLLDEVALETANSREMRETRKSESIVDYLNEPYRSANGLAAISAHLRNGRCVVLSNAFRLEFAEKMYTALDEHERWDPYEEIVKPELGFHHHNIYATHLFPEALRECEFLFSSPATKQLASRLTDRDCDGPISFGASLYLPGDYSLPHCDASMSRNVTFIWHLTKDWQKNWGGDLYWCPALHSIPPTFNTLTLFNVSDTTVHFVQHVRPMARGRRYGINGWWQSASERTARTPLHSPPSEGAAIAEIPGMLVL